MEGGETLRLNSLGTVSFLGARRLAKMQGWFQPWAGRLPAAAWAEEPWKKK